MKTTIQYLIAVLISVMSLETHAQKVLTKQEKSSIGTKKTVKNTKKTDDTFIAVKGKTNFNKDITLTSHVDGDQAMGAIILKGKGMPGEVFLLSLNAYAYVTNDGGLFFGDGPEGYSKRYFKNHKVTVDQKGNWEIPVFQSIGKTEWMRQAFIVSGWTVEIGPLSPDDQTYPEKSKHFIRLVSDEKYRSYIMNVKP